MLGRKCFGDERRAARPLAAKAEPEPDSEHGELHRRLGEAACRRKQRIQQHAGHERALSPEPVGEHPKGDTAGRGRKQRHGIENARGGQRKMKLRILDERCEDHRIQHHVESIEHPAERRGDKRPVSTDVRSSPPVEHSHGRSS